MYSPFAVGQTRERFRSRRLIDMHRTRNAACGEGKSVQADETYYGNTSKRAKGYKKGHSHKQQIVALVEPKGRARAVQVKTATANTVREIFVTNVSRK
jgi:hypothetical protein